MRRHAADPGDRAGRAHLEQRGAHLVAGAVRPCGLRHWHHRAELVEPERPAALADAVLNEQHRPVGGRLDEQRDHREQRRQHDEREPAADDVEASFEGQGTARARLQLDVRGHRRDRPAKHEHRLRRRRPFAQSPDGAASVCSRNSALFVRATTTLVTAVDTQCPSCTPGANPTSTGRLTNNRVPAAAARGMTHVRRHRQARICRRQSGNTHAHALVCWSGLLDEKW